MLHYSFFKTLTNQTVTIELKNDIRIRGILKSVDQYLNIKLDDIEVLDLAKYPHLSSVKNMFIRGSVVRYVMLPRSEVDVGLLEDATRRGELRFVPRAEFLISVYVLASLKTFAEVATGIAIRINTNIDSSYRGCQPGWQSSLNDHGLNFTTNHASRSSIPLFPPGDIQQRT